MRTHICSRYTYFIGRLRRPSGVNKVRKDLVRASHSQAAAEHTKTVLPLESLNNEPFIVRGLPRSVKAAAFSARAHSPAGPGPASTAASPAAACSRSPLLASRRSPAARSPPLTSSPPLLVAATSQPAATPKHGVSKSSPEQ